MGTTGCDRIDLSGIDANLNYGGNQAFAFSTSRAAGTVALSEQGTNTILSGHVNNDGVADTSQFPWGLLGLLGLFGLMGRSRPAVTATTVGTTTTTNRH